MRPNVARLTKSCTLHLTKAAGAGSYWEKGRPQPILNVSNRIDRPSLALVTLRKSLGDTWMQSMQSTGFRAFVRFGENRFRILHA